jgi:hypothetical protein
LKQIDKPRGETKGRDRRGKEEMIHKRETKDQRYRGEREVERKIGEIHKGEILRRERRRKRGDILWI